MRAGEADQWDPASAFAGRSRDTSDITATIPGLSDRLLSERLKQLEAEGIVTRTVYAETPVRVEYRLTEKGRALTDVVVAISVWAERWLGPEDAAADGEADCGAA